MTCRECRDLMLEVARQRAAPFVDRTVLAHVASCAECGRHLERERAITVALRAAAFAVEDTAASPDVETRLMTAFAAQQAPALTPRSRARAIATRWLPLAAAVVLLIGGMTWIWQPGRVASSGPQVARAGLPGGLAPLPVASSVPPVASAAAPKRGDGANPGAGRSSRSGHRPARPAERPVQAVGFIPIPSAAGLPDFESGEIVRLGIEVTALPNYGLEIPAGAHATIQADFLVGQDGQARAIRLVNADAQAPRTRQ